MTKADMKGAFSSPGMHKTLGSPANGQLTPEPEIHAPGSKLDQYTGTGHRVGQGSLHGAERMGSSAGSKVPPTPMRGKA